MAPLEINAAGRPVVAYGAGGATETVIEQVERDTVSRADD